MKASEIKPNFILYWDEEPVNVKEIYIGPNDECCITVILPNKNKLVTIDKTPTNLTVIEVSKVYRDERFAQPIQYELRCIGSDGIAQHISGQCNFPFEVPLLDSKIEEPVGLYSSRRN